MSSPAGVNRPAAWRPPVSSKARWAARSRSGSARMTERETTGPSGSGSVRRATSSIEALPQIPHDAVATKWRSATFESSNGRDRRTTIVSSGWLSAPGSPPLVPSTSWPSSRPSVRRNPTASSASLPGRPHRDRDRDRVLARPGGADLERRLADDPVVADLERFAADRHDPAAGHVPDRRDRVAAGQPGHRVASRAWPNAVRASRGGLRRIERPAEGREPGEAATGRRPSR